jgi:dihydropteroate synthase
VLPVVSGLAAKGFRISIDTMKPQVAREALAAGASIVNDVTGFRDAEMAAVCARAGCTVCLMHMKGEPKTMQMNPHYDNVVAEVREYLLERARWAEAQGIAKDKIWLDPGIGFGKTTQHNLLLLKHLDHIAQLGYPVLVGVSRKAFIGRLLRTHDDPLPATERLEGTLAAQALAQANGASIIRAHDVREARRAINIAQAILTA